MLYKNHNPELFGNVPADLKSQNQWILWGYVAQKDTSKKPRKMPKYVNGAPRKGDQNSPEQKSHLACFDDATFSAEMEDCGIGFQMLKDDGLVAVDLDDCIDQNGKLDEYSSSIIKDLPGYWEISPSGKGVRGFFKGSTKTRRNDKFEVYCGVQFLTVTGNALTNNRDLTEFKEVFGGVTETKNTTFEEEDWIPKQVGGDDWEIAKKALKHIDPDCEYPKWIEVAQSLQDGFGDDGLDLFLDWSRNGAKFTSDEEATAQYRKFRPGKGIRFASLIHSAKEGGMPAHEMRPPSEKPKEGLKMVNPYKTIDPKRESSDWEDYLQYSTPQDGKPSKLLKKDSNLALILANHPQLPSFTMDVMKGIKNIGDHPVPWHEDGNGRFFSEDFAAPLAHWVSEAYGVNWSADRTLSVMIAVAGNNKINPLIEMLEGLPKWDGVPRVENFGIDWFHCDDTPLNKAMFKCFFLSAVMRAYQPGCAVHSALIFEGKQQAGKSRTIELLAMQDNLFGKLGRSIRKTDTIIQAHQFWIIEIDELASLKFAEVEEIKTFITNRTDTFRKPYERESFSHPRRFVFMGSTNSDEYLRDATGNRRFWPVEVKRAIPEKDFKVLKDFTRYQLWAETVEKFKSGEWSDPFLPKELRKNLEDENKKRLESDYWQEEIENLLDKDIPNDYLDYESTTFADSDNLVPRTMVKLSEIHVALNLTTDQVDRPRQVRIKNILTVLGWKKGQRKDSKGRRISVYYKAGK